MEIVFDQREDTLRRIAEHYKKGEPPKVTCPACGAALVIRYSESAGAIAALFCPTDRGHAQIVGEADPGEFWGQFQTALGDRQRGGSAGDATPS